MSSSSFTPQLRPLSIGEVLDAGFTMFRRHFGTLVFAVLIPVVPFAILATFVAVSIDPNFYDLDVAWTGETTRATWAANAIQWFALAIGFAAAFKVVSDAYIGDRTSAGRALRYGLGRLGVIVVTYLVLLLIFLPLGVASLLILPVLLFIWIAVKLSMTLPVVLLERKGPFAAIGRSWRLVRRNWWRTFGTLLVVVLLMFVLQFGLAALLGGGVLLAEDTSEFAVGAIETVANIVVLTLVYPLVAAIVTVLYYDLRVRHEGFDLQLLARGVGADEERFAAAPERPTVPGPPAPPEPTHGGFAPPQGPAASA